MRGPTLILRPLSFDRQNAEKSTIFFSLFSFLLPFSFSFPQILFDFFLSPFSFYLIFLFWIIIDRIGQVRKLPPSFLHATCHSHVFLPYFFISLLPFIASCNTWLILSHTFHMANCEPLIPSASHGSCHVLFP